MPTYRGGRHEHGQNYLADRKIIALFARLIATTRGPIVEIGPGRGALTQQLESLGRPLTAVETDPSLTSRLRQTLSSDVTVVNQDFLAWPLPHEPHVVVGNVPFHLTTAILRKLLHASSWTQAVLLVKWEVARRRAGVGGASMMTAQWWPWVEFSIEGRVPRSAFRPAPNVDGGLLVMSKRTSPLISPRDRSAYRQFVHDVFTGKGHGIAAVLAKLTGQGGRRSVTQWLAREGIESSALPKDLSAQQWSLLFNAVQRSGRRPMPVRPQRGDRR